MIVKIDRSNLLRKKPGPSALVFLPTLIPVLQLPGADPLDEIEGGDQRSGVPQLFLFVDKLHENRFEVGEAQTQAHREETG